MAVDSANNVILCGRLTKSLEGATYVGGQYDMVLMRINTDLTVYWTVIVGTSGADAAFGGKLIIYMPMNENSLTLFLLC